ncbi:beta-lactamase/transpeptidase-like protein [Hyaloraphidium curvatum]|nr:beta-lactamase/transpeptidase-like protein [Hyaloraphidium curvatum]
MAGLDVQSLLGMSSGLPDFMNSPTGAVPQVVANPSKAWTCEELIAIGLAQGVKPAGTTGYSTTNYLILQLMIEKLTGSTLDSQLQARFCVPMGMKGTYLPPNNNTALPEPAAHSVINENAQAEFAEAGGTVALGTDVTGWNASYGQGGGSMTGNICDLLTWADSLCGNTTLPPDLAAKRLELKEIMPGMNYGLGIHSEGSFLGHEGEALGWETYALKWPEKGISVALAGNSCKIKLLFLIILSALFPDAGVKVFA